MIWPSIPEQYTPRFLDGIRNSIIGRVARTAPSFLKLLAFGNLSEEQRSKAVAMYFRGRPVQGLFATLPRSGWHFLTLLLGVTLDLRDGGDGEYDFYDKLDRGDSGRKAFHVRDRELLFGTLDWRAVYGHPALSDNPEILHSHMPFYRVTSLPLPDMRTVIVVRNAWHVIDSLIDKFEVGAQDIDAYIDGSLGSPYDFPEMLRFFNSWGTRLEQTNTLCVRYEDLVRNPANWAHEILTFLGYEGVTLELATNAAALCSKEKNLEKIKAAGGQTGDKRVRFAESRVSFSEMQEAKIQQMLSKSRYAAFGYDLRSGK